jgi:hypothetical protein
LSKATALRVSGALVVVGLGLVAAFAGSSTTPVQGKTSRGAFQRLSPSGVGRSSGAPEGRTKREIKHGPRVAPAEFNGSVRKLPQIAPKRLVRPEREERELELPTAQKQPLAGAEEPSSVSTPARSAPAPAPDVTFKGLDKFNWGAGFPPDTVGDVGPNHFVQAVNTSIGIFSKSVAPPHDPLAAFTFDALFTGTGTACDADNQGDPTVVYDPQADHWIVADFAFTGDGSTPPFFECIAVSQTGDPVNGGWWGYAIRTDDASHPFFADYPKMGIWPDGLYMTANMFSDFGPEEVRVWAFNRSDLEAGLPVRNVVVDVGDLDTVPHMSLLPSNMRSVTGVPPAGRPNLLVSESIVDFAFEVWKFHVDYSGSGSTFTGPTNVSQAMYNFDEIDAPTPGNSLDSLFDRLMMQAQYVNIGGSESVWVNHTVRCCGPGATTPLGIQWAQLNVSVGAVSTAPVQQQIYPPVKDTLHRWMGSLAVDRNGDMALGYSVANLTTNPDIRYAGRLVGDTLNTLPQTETTMLAGVTRGTQTGFCGGAICHRWGDYSAMTLDPDGCTYWYTQEYYETTTLPADWQTRIGSFRFPSCTPKTLQSIDFAPLLDKTLGDADFTVSASASSGLPVTFTASGSCTVSGSTVHLTGGGSCTITALQAGDATFGPAPDVARTFAIAKASQTIAFAALPDKTAVDADFGVAATASSGLAVSFAGSGSCTVNGSTVHLTGPGSCTVTASQPGDASFNAAPAVAQSFSITKANQSIAFGALGGKTFGDADVALTATASSGLPVAFAASGTCTVNGVTLHITAAGSCNVTASQPGNASYNAAADVAQTIAVAKRAQTITFRALASKKFGAPNFTVSATASSGLPVAFAAGGKCTVSGKTVHLTGAGKCTIIASQSGNANFNAAASVSRAFKIAPPQCNVPRVKGKLLAAAKSAIKQRHCRTGKVTYAFSKTIKKGRVVSQSRRPGRILPANTKINLVVSRGRKP